MVEAKVEDEALAEVEWEAPTLLVLEEIVFVPVAETLYHTSRCSLHNLNLFQMWRKNDKGLS